jgi:hypothetical protein
MKLSKAYGAACFLAGVFLSLISMSFLISTANANANSFQSDNDTILLEPDATAQPEDISFLFFINSMHAEIKSTGVYNGFKVGLHIQIPSDSSVIVFSDRPARISKILPGGASGFARLYANSDFESNPPNFTFSGLNKITGEETFTVAVMGEPIDAGGSIIIPLTDILGSLAKPPVGDYENVSLVVDNWFDVIVDAVEVTGAVLGTAAACTFGEAVPVAGQLACAGGVVASAGLIAGTANDIDQAIDEDDAEAAAQQAAQAAQTARDQLRKDLQTETARAEARELELQKALAAEAKLEQARYDAYLRDLKETKTLDHFFRECSLDYYPACVQFSRLIYGGAKAVNERYQADFPNSPSEARLALKKACDKGLGCFDLGRMMRSGFGGPKQEDQGDRITSKACAFDELSGCYDLCYAREQNSPKFDSFMVHPGDACMALVKDFSAKRDYNPRYYSQQVSQPYTALLRACGIFDQPEGCYRQAVYMLIKGGDAYQCAKCLAKPYLNADPMVLLLKACNNGTDAACVVLGERASKKELFDQWSDNRYATALQRACRDSAFDNTPQESLCA